MGTLTVASKRRGSWNHLRVLANLAKFERLRDPDHQGPDTDPVGYARVGRRIVVADAGANDVLSVKRSTGKINAGHRLRQPDGTQPVRTPRQQRADADGPDLRGDRSRRRPLRQ